MHEILIKKLHSDVNIPKYETEGSSGLDLEAYIEKDLRLLSGERKLVPTGISVAMPNNFEIQIRPRSGLAYKNGISVVNTPGTIDSDYIVTVMPEFVTMQKDLKAYNADLEGQMQEKVKIYLKCLCL